VLLVRADSRYQTLTEMVAALRATPELLTTGNLVGWWSAALAQALSVVGLNDVGPSLKDSKLRALAVTERTPTLPAVPSFQEQGVDVTLGWWRGLAVPTNTPDEVVDRLAVGLRQALDSPDLRTDFGRNGLSVDPLDGPAFRQVVLSEYQAAGALFTSLGINMRVAKPG
jgi:tripartite-type tricarboxylate transporter receptor subunit TctC